MPSFHVYLARVSINYSCQETVTLKKKKIVSIFLISYFCSTYSTFHVVAFLHLQFQHLGWILNTIIVCPLGPLFISLQLKENRQPSYPSKWRKLLVEQPHLGQLSFQLWYPKPVNSRIDVAIVHPPVVIVRWHILFFHRCFVFPVWPRKSNPALIVASKILVTILDPRSRIWYRNGFTIFCLNEKIQFNLSQQMK